ncbi:MAG: sigma-70 family RNA polymerase sigma factor [Planctomycetes bacterium]|nr:sigma-70 family RNA polymerase sigma factor [Planctomycetota bacterium]
MGSTDEEFFETLRAGKIPPYRVPEEVYEQYAWRVKCYFDRLNRTRTKETSQDLLGEWFLLLHRKWPHVQLRTEAELRSWLFRIARSVVSAKARYWGALKRHGDVAFPNLSDAATDLSGMDPGRRLDEQSQLDLIHQALAEMDGEYHRVLWLRLFEDRSAKEIARYLGKSTDAVNSTYRRAIAKLRARLRGNPGGMEKHQ